MSYFSRETPYWKLLSEVNSLVEWKNPEQCKTPSVSWVRAAWIAYYDYHHAGWNPVQDLDAPFAIVEAPGLETMLRSEPLRSKDALDVYCQIQKTIKDFTWEEELWMATGGEERPILIIEGDRLGSQLEALLDTVLLYWGQNDRNSSCG